MIVPTLNATNSCTGYNILIQVLNMKMYSVTTVLTISHY